VHVVHARLAALPVVDHPDVIELRVRPALRILGAKRACQVVDLAMVPAHENDFAGVPAVVQQHAREQQPVVVAKAIVDREMQRLRERLDRLHRTIAPLAGARRDDDVRFRKAGAEQTRERFGAFGSLRAEMKAVFALVLAVPHQHHDGRA